MLLRRRRWRRCRSCSCSTNNSTSRSRSPPHSIQTASAAQHSSISGQRFRCVSRPCACAFACACATEQAPRDPSMSAHPLDYLAPQSFLRMRWANMTTPTRRAERQHGQSCDGAGGWQAAGAVGAQQEAPGVAEALGGAPKGRPQNESSLRIIIILLAAIWWEHCMRSLGREAAVSMLHSRKSIGSEPESAPQYVHCERLGG